MASRPLSLEVSDGTRLEAEIDVAEGRSPTSSRLAVLAHPHPLYGGSMDAGLIDELFRLLPARGIGALRFNFRGVGGSTGRHDEGRAERLDVAAALDAAITEAGPDTAVFLCGWSFGADMCLAVADPRHRGWVCVAPPLRLVPAGEMAAPSDPRPKLLLVPEHDQFRPPAAASEATSGWTATEVVPIAGADHFMWGHAVEAADRIAAFAAAPA
jgi:alpha/beta superfamily hydrolase